MSLHFMKLDRAHRLTFVIVISSLFFVAEISIGFYTHSLALVADAFHYLNDLLGFIVALVALKLSRREQTHETLSFGWDRAQVLGAFFNGVFLLALGVAIFLHAIERFICLDKVENPVLVLMMGCIGLFLNVICVLFLHEHDHGGLHAHGTALDMEHHSNFTDHEVNGLSHHHHHQSGHDLGTMGVLIHVVGDAINNIGVIIAAAVIWKAKHEGRFYADPGVSVAIAIMIALSALPLVNQSGSILLECVPPGVRLEDVKQDLEKIEGVVAVRELHAWRLSQTHSIASAHIITSDDSLSNFMIRERLIKDRLRTYGIHTTTIQPSLVSSIGSSTSKSSEVSYVPHVDIAEC